MIRFHITLRLRRRPSEQGNRQVSYWVAFVRGIDQRFRGRTRAEAFGRAALHVAGLVRLQEAAKAERGSL